MLYYLAKEFMTPKYSATHKELRELCDHHACLDSSNFSANFGKDHWHIVGKGSSRTYKLNPAGKTEAKSLLSHLAGAS